MLAFYSEDGTESVFLNDVVPMNKTELPTTNVELRQVSSQMSDLIKRALYAKVPFQAAKTIGTKSYQFSYDGKSAKLILTEFNGDNHTILFNDLVSRFRSVKP